MNTDFVKNVSLARGLNLLMRSNHGRWSDFDEVIKESTRLPKHPFNLDLPGEEKGDVSWKKHQEVILVADPTASDRSVNNMVAHLWFGLQNFDNLRRLREIRVGPPGECRIVFEAWTRLGIFICGGCTDHSGAGGHATADMRSIFNLLSTVYQLTQEIMYISHEEALSTLGEEKCREIGLI